MRRKGYLLPALVIATAALVNILAGCNAPPAIVVAELPAHSIHDAPPPEPGSRVYVPPSAAQPVRQQVKPQPAVIAAATPDKAGPWAPPAHDRPWRWIVIHHSAGEIGSAAVFNAEHMRRGWDELGYHFVIDNGRGGPDGQVEIGPRWSKQKWGAHAGGTPGNAYNNYGVGICLVGDFTDHLPTASQLASLRRLVFYLSDRYDIEPSRIIGHRDAPGHSTACPGNLLHRYLYDTLRPEIARRQGELTRR